MSNDYQQKDNNGTLFKNDRKETDKHPNYKGDAIINGKPMWISAWVKEGKNGKYMSLSFTPKQQGGGGKPSNQSPSYSQKPPTEDDVPF